MKIKLLIIILTCSCILCFGEENIDESTNSEKDEIVNPCKEFIEDSFSTIPKLYKDEARDSLDSIIERWYITCAPIYYYDPIDRIKIINDIWNNRLESELLDEFYFERLVYSYLYNKNTMNYFYRICLWDPIDTTFIQLEMQYNIFIIEMANDLLQYQKKGTDEYILCKYYSKPRENIFDLIKSSSFSNSKLHQLYKKYVHNVKNEAEGNLSLISGIWFPQGNAKILGKHPIFGFQVGGRKYKFTYNLVLLFRFSDSEKRFLIEHDNEMISTKHFLGGYYGLDFGREMLRSTKHELYSLVGIGLDGFDTLKSGRETVKSINSLNINIGLGYKYRLKIYQTHYIGFQAKYNFVNYKNKDGTDLSGNTISFQILFGFDGNINKFSKLKLFNTW